MRRVVIADNLAGLRSALRCLLEQEFEVEIVDEISETRALLAALPHLTPDLILLDWALPGLNSLEMRHHLITAVRGLYPCVSLVVLWGSGVDHLPRGLPGVDAWVSKAEPPQQLRATLHAIWPTPGGRQHRHALGSVFIPRQ